MIETQVKITGLERLRRALVRAGDKAPQVAAKALYEEAQEAFLLSQEIVPVRDGPLKSSGRVIPSAPRGSFSFCRIVYGGTSAGYALFVHEIPPSRARHAAPTRWKYLEMPVKEYAKGMEGRMAVRVINILNTEFR